MLNAKSHRRKKKPIKDNTEPEPKDARKESLSELISREAFALVIMGFGIVSLVSVLRPIIFDDYTKTGTITICLDHFYALWFGKVALMPPLLIAALGLRLLFAKPTLKLYRVMLGTYLILFSLSSFLHVLRDKSVSEGSILGVKPAGLFGQFNHDLIVPFLFDTWGGCVIFAIILVLGISIVTLKSPASILKRPAGIFADAGIKVFSVCRKVFRRFLGFPGWLWSLVGRFFKRIRATATSIKDAIAALARRALNILDMNGKDPVSESAAKTAATANESQKVDPEPDTRRRTDIKERTKKKSHNSSENKEDKSKDTPVSEVQKDIDKYEYNKEAMLFSDGDLSVLPPVSILDDHRDLAGGAITDQTKTLIDTLNSFGVNAKVINRMVGPVVTRYELQPAPGVKVSSIVRLADDLALSLAANGIRIEAPIPGKAAIGIEVPNKEPALVGLREIAENDEFQNAKSKLTVVLGKDIAGRCIIGDLVRMVHLLVAGATGAGKSVCLNTLITSILMKATPDQVKFLMIDPKMVELTTYDGIPHLMAPVITDPKKAAGYLLWVVEQMENRYKLFHAAGVRNIERYNALCMEQAMDGDDAKEKFLPYYVVIVDELADMMMVAQAEVEASISRLAFMARAAGIHLVIATQRPSADVVTGIIKANIPSRIAFSVSSGIDSRIILDSVGAEKLLGRGDMLYLPNGAGKPVRVQGAYVSDDEIQRMTEYLRDVGKPKYEAESRALKDVQPTAESADEDEDEYFREAVKLVVETGQASASMLQRRFRIGYSRAGRLIDTMEDKKIIGPHEGSKPRKILFDNNEWQKWLPESEEDDDTDEETATTTADSDSEESTPQEEDKPESD